MRKHSVQAVSTSMQKWITKHYAHLMETFLQKGYERKMLFPVYCVQMFEKNYLDYEQQQVQEQFTHEESF